MRVPLYVAITGAFEGTRFRLGGGSIYCRHTHTHTHTHTQQLLSPADEVPTVSDLEGLKQKDGTTLNIIEEIGSHYGSLGIQLLHDRRGTIMDGITHDHKGHVNIKKTIFEKWLGGTGMQPRTWRTLVKLMESNTIRLTVIASDIRNTLQ